MDSKLHGPRPPSASRNSGADHSGLSPLRSVLHGQRKMLAAVWQAGGRVVSQADYQRRFRAAALRPVEVGTGMHPYCARSAAPSIRITRRPHTIAQKHTHACTLRQWEAGVERRVSAVAQVASRAALPHKLGRTDGARCCTQFESVGSHALRFAELS